MKIVLLEFIDEAKALIRQRGVDFCRSSSTKIICMDPKVRSFLLSQDIKAESSIEYFPNASQHRIVLQCEQWVNTLLKDVRIVDQLGISRGYHENLVYHLRYYINHFLYCIEMVKNACSKHQAAEIHVPILSDEGLMYTSEARLQSSERFLGSIAQVYAKSNNIKFQPINNKVNERNNIFYKLFSFLIRLFAKSVAFIDFKLLMSRNYTDTQNVIVPALSYRMNYVLNDIKKINPIIKTFIIWEGKGNNKQLLSHVLKTFKVIKDKMFYKSEVKGMIHLDLIAGFFKKSGDSTKVIQSMDQLALKIRDEYKKLFVYENICISEWLSKKVEIGLKQEMVNLQHATNVMAEIYKVIQPKLVLSMYSIGIYDMMGELAKRQNIKAVSITHGSHVPPNNEYDKIENYQLGKTVILNSFPYVSVQSPWADKYLDYYKDKRNRLLTGPLLFSKTSVQERDQLRQEILGKKSSGKIIVHATTLKVRHAMRLHIAETVDEYIAGLRDVCESVNESEDVYLIIRPHPASKLSMEDFKRLLPLSDRIHIIQKGSFARVLSAADLLVSFSSTCIEEALQNNIPVVLYDKWRRYNHFNIQETQNVSELKRQPVSYITQAEVLRAGISKTLVYFDKQKLTDDELKAYKYPVNYSNNFNQFIDQVFYQDRLSNKETVEV